MAIVSHEVETVIGVDTHARNHVFCKLDAATGAKLDLRVFPATAAGIGRALSWAGKDGSRVLVAIEGTGSYGARLAEAFMDSGVRVAEMDVPLKRHRKAGKSDELDAEDIARRALATPPGRLAVVRRKDGHRAALQVLLTARRQLTKARTSLVNALTAMLRSHDLGLDARRALTDAQMATIAGWRPRASDDLATAVAREEAIRLATEIARANGQLEHNLNGLAKHVTALCPQLLEGVGIGPVTAAQILASYSHPGRFRSEAAFARFAGTAPIPASSGNTQRHRLHRGGDRALNSALWRIAFYRACHDEHTQAYVLKRTAQGDSFRDIQRRLKRYIARSLYRQLTAQLA